MDSSEIKRRDSANNIETDRLNWKTLSMNFGIPLGITA
jgi:hypothetical protein